MAPNTGPTNPALILLCTLGTLLLACSAPTGQLPSPDQLKLLSYLLESAESLYEDYKKKENMQPPEISSCPTDHPLPSTHLDPGFFLPLIRAIKPIVNRTLKNRPEVDEIIEILQRLQVEDTTERPVMVTTPACLCPMPSLLLPRSIRSDSGLEL
ncbi:interleukin-31-like [Suncus etruscus]|uniref:interleukin-31-like n=1 Tax=Suncus etruscus TaxID=109475 RepID=UPI00210FA538|nr:interleukin-31-like [Suncus etruscus]